MQSLELALRLGNLGSATAIVTELSNIAVKKKERRRMHASRMRTVRCSSRPVADPGGAEGAMSPPAL